MLTRRTFTLALVALASVFAASASANHRQTFDRLESLAIRTRNHSRELASHIRNHRLPLGQAYVDLAQMQQIADNVRVVADNYGDPRQIAADVQQLTHLLDRVSHQVQRLGGWRGDEGDIRHMNRLVLELQDDVVQLQARLQTLSGPVITGYPGSFHGNPVYRNPGYGQPTYVNPGFGGQPACEGPALVAPQVQLRPALPYGTSGFSIGGPRFSMHFGR